MLRLLPKYWIDAALVGGIADLTAGLIYLVLSL
jgi:hypothetical protein